MYDVFDIFIIIYFIKYELDQYLWIYKLILSYDI